MRDCPLGGGLFLVGGSAAPSNRFAICNAELKLCVEAKL